MNIGNDPYLQRSCASSRYSSRTTLQAEPQMQPLNLDSPLPPLPPVTLDEKSGMGSTTALPNISSPNHATPEPQTPPNWLQRTWLHWFTAYRILMGLAFIANFICFALWLSKEVNTDLRLSNVLLAVSINLFVAVIVRQEDWINASFALISKLPLNLPLKTRALIADFHHYGGLHIGAALSSSLWYILFVVLNTINTAACIRENKMTVWLWIDIVTCYLFMLFLLFICVTAHPKLRAKFHDSFEHTHRFAGWASLAVLWLNTGIAPRAHPSSPPLATSPALYLLSAITFLIALPWLRIRRVPIRAEKVSARELKITFPYAHMPYTSTVRFSRSPLMEWHAFATIPSPDGFTASIIISQAGDWTRDIIASPPSTLWLRSPPAKNFLACVPLFSSLLLVATGAGIGPMLSLLLSPSIAAMRAQGRAVRVLWCVYEPDAPHWGFVQQIIRAVDPAPRIFDSKKGRPDVAFEARYLAKVEGLEAVMVVSNKSVTEGVVSGVKRAGGCAYGAVFDS